MKKSLLKLLMSLLMIMTATVTASAQCYILGNDGNWQTNKASAELPKTDIDGVYEGEVTFAPNANYFGIVTKLTEKPGQWSVLREYRYGPATANQLLSYDNPAAMVFQKDASFKVPGKRIRDASRYTSKKISLKLLFLSDIFLFPFVRQQFPVLA